MPKLTIASLFAALAAQLGSAEFTAESLAKEVAAMRTSLAGATPASAKLFITTYCNPADLKKAADDGKAVEDLAAGFVESGKAAVLHAVLGGLQFTDVQMDDAAKTMSLKASNPDAPGQIRFAFIDGKWYVMN